MSHRHILLGAAAFAAVLTLSACSAPQQSSHPTKQAPTPSHTATASQTDGATDVLAEREAFAKAQQFPLDGTLLSAKTEPQKAFVAQERANVEAHGQTWDAERENIYLALAADACETSILNSHQLRIDTFRVHVLGEPIIAKLIPADTAPDQKVTFERNLMSFAVNGTKYLCPADYQQWLDAFDKAYPAAG